MFLFLEFRFPVQRAWPLSFASPNHHIKQVGDDRSRHSEKTQGSFTMTDKPRQLSYFTSPRSRR